MRLPLSLRIGALMVGFLMIASLCRAQVIAINNSSFETPPVVSPATSLTVTTVTPGLGWTTSGDSPVQLQTRSFLLTRGVGEGLFGGLQALRVYGAASANQASWASQTTGTVTQPNKTYTLKVNLSAMAGGSGANIYSGFNVTLSAGANLSYTVATAYLTSAPTFSVSAAASGSNIASANYSLSNGHNPALGQYSVLTITVTTAAVLSSPGALTVRLGAGDRGADTSVIFDSVQLSEVININNFSFESPAVAPSTSLTVTTATPGFGWTTGGTLPVQLQTSSFLTTRQVPAAFFDGVQALRVYGSGSAHIPSSASQSPGATLLANTTYTLRVNISPMASGAGANIYSGFKVTLSAGSNLSYVVSTLYSGSNFTVSGQPSGSNLESASYSLSNGCNPVLGEYTTLTMVVTTKASVSAADAVTVTLAAGNRADDTSTIFDVVRLTAATEAGPTAWLREGKYGISLSYDPNGIVMPSSSVNGISVMAQIVSGGESPWSQIVNGFNAEAFADQVAEMGASWVIFPIGAARGYYCSPNTTYEGYCGLAGGEFTSKRDLIADVATALNARGIKLIAYVAGEGPMFAMPMTSTVGGYLDVAVKTYAAPGAAGSAYPNNGPSGPAYRTEFRTLFNAMIKEWSMRWGSKVSGWWIDGCFEWTGYNNPAVCDNGQPLDNLNALIAAAKTGNPDTLVAANPGQGKTFSLSASQDYLAGEVGLALSAYDKFFRYPTSRFVSYSGPDGSRQIPFHQYSYLGNMWGRSDRGYVNEDITSYVSAVNDLGAGITMDVGINVTGQIFSQHVDQLKTLKAALKPTAAPSVTAVPMPTAVNLALFRRTYCKSNKPEKGNGNIDGLELYAFIEVVGSDVIPHRSRSAVDGNMDTTMQIQTPATAGIYGEYDYSFIVDLGSEQDFDRVGIFFGAGGHATSYQIYYSDTGLEGSWQYLNTAQTTYTASDNNLKIHDADSLKNSRYVKLKALAPTGPGQMTLTEFEVYKVNGSTPTAQDTVWVDEKLPAGSTAGTAGSGSWNWTTTSQVLNWFTAPPAGIPFAKRGLKLFWSGPAAGEQQINFDGAQGPLKIGTGDHLYFDVWMDPLNLPTEIMLMWRDSTGSNEHRVYWGANTIAAGTAGTNSRRYAGVLPAAGEWVRLTVPASQVGLEGQSLKGMTFAHYNGRVFYDRAGRTTVNSYSSGSAPESLMAVPGNGKITLTWKPVFGASSYNLYVGFSPGGPYTPVAAGIAATKHTETSLVNGTTYYYVVRAVKDGVESANSGEAHATPLAP